MEENLAVSFLSTNANIALITCITNTLAVSCIIFVQSEEQQFPFGEQIMIGLLVFGEFGLVPELKEAWLLVVVFEKRRIFNRM